MGNLIKHVGDKAHTKQYEISHKHITKLISQNIIMQENIMHKLGM